MRDNVKLSGLLACLILLTACLTPAAPQLTNVAPAPIAGAQNVQLLIFPADSAETVTKTIATARQRVLMTIYLLTDSDVIDALKTAHQNGAAVRILLEPHPYRGDSLAVQAYETLRQAGLSVKNANPEYRYTHQKSMVVDNTAIVLTANLTKSGLAHNREFGIITTDPADVGEITDAFEADWTRTTFTATSPHLVWSPQNSRTRLDDLLNSTTHSLLVYAEEVQDDGQVESMVKLAADGKSVHLLTSPPQDNAKDANAVGLDKLQRGGVRVRYLAQPYIHAKVFIVDETTGFVGSQNVSTMSMEFNRELGILIADKSVISRMTRTFEDDWNRAVER